MTVPKRVVVVDDDAYTLRLAEHCLRPPEFQTYTYMDARDALMKLHDIVPDLILSDVLMPEMDGRKFFEVVKRSSELKDVPFIFLSGVRTPEDVIAMLNAGADDFLAKPFPVAKLLAKIRATLRMAERLSHGEPRYDAVSGNLGVEGALPLLRFCEDTRVTGRVSVDAGVKLWVEFAGGTLVAAGAVPAVDPEAVEELLHDAKGASYRMEHRSRRSEDETAAVDPGGEESLSAALSTVLRKARVLEKPRPSVPPLELPEAALREAEPETAPVGSSAEPPPALRDPEVSAPEPPLPLMVITAAAVEPPVQEAAIEKTDPQPTPVAAIELPAPDTASLAAGEASDPEPVRAAPTDTANETVPPTRPTRKRRRGLRWLRSRGSAPLPEPTEVLRETEPEAAAVASSADPPPAVADAGASAPEPLNAVTAVSVEPDQVAVIEATAPQSAPVAAIEIPPPEPDPVAEVEVTRPEPILQAAIEAFDPELAPPASESVVEIVSAARTAAETRRRRLTWFGIAAGLAMAGQSILVLAGTTWLVQRTVRRVNVTPPIPVPAETARRATPIPAAPIVAPPPSLPAPSLLSLTSDPPGAAVFVASKARGVTPVRLELEAGNTSVLLRKEGFIPWARQVRLTAGREARLEASLIPLPSERPSIATPPPEKVIRTGDLVPLGSEVRPPRKISVDTGPSFRGGSPRLKQPATVLVEFVVTENGAVTDARIVESGGEVLDKACLDAVTLRRYEPAEVMGVRVKVIQAVRFTFQPR